jgi:hypothetical protein
VKGVWSLSGKRSPFQQPTIFQSLKVKQSNPIDLDSHASHETIETLNKSQFIKSRPGNLDISIKAHSHESSKSAIVLGRGSFVVCPFDE